MAAIVQSKTNSGTGASNTMVLDSAATNGNHAIYLGYADSQAHSGACTFGGSNMTTDASTVFDQVRIARFLVDAAGTSLVATFGGSSLYRGVAIEISGLTATPYEATVGHVSDGEGSSTSHSCEYASGDANRCVVAFVGGSNAVTFTGANGSTAIQIDTNFAAIFKDNIGAGAGSVDYTTSGADDQGYTLVTYLTAAGGSTVPLNILIPSQIGFTPGR